jgi:hypothetical protein
MIADAEFELADALEPIRVRRLRCIKAITKHCHTPQRFGLAAREARGVCMLTDTAVDSFIEDLQHGFIHNNEGKESK